MRISFERLLRNGRGVSLMFVRFGFMAFVAATTLAIDTGAFMVARSQAQHSADAGVLAGATALRAQAGKNITLNITNFNGFFLEPLTGAGEVKGRITPVGGIMDANAGHAPAAAFPYVIRLVQ